MAKRRRFGSVFQRGKVWYVRVRTNTGELKRAIGPSRKLAEAALAKLELAEARGEVLGTQDVPAITLAEFRAEFEHSRADKARGTKRADAGRYDLMEKRWPVTPLRDLSVADVEDLISHLVTRKRCKCEPEEAASCDHVGAKGGTVNRYLALLSAVMRSAIARGYAKENPCTGIRRRQENAHDVTVVSAAELVRLTEAAPADLRPAITFASETGARRSELAAATWQDLDLAPAPHGVLLVRRGKSARGRRAIPLTRRGRAVIDELRETRGPLPLRGTLPLFDVLSAERGLDRISRAVPKASADAGLPRLRLHDLRHLYAVRYIRAGTPISDVAKMLGDTLAVVCARYGRHVPADAGAAAVARLEAAETTAAEAASA